MSIIAGWGKEQPDGGKEQPGALFACRTRTMKQRSRGLMARLGVPMGGRVRKLRAVKGSLATPPKEEI
jgi:hypothetical protein